MKLKLSLDKVWQWRNCPNKENC